MAQESVTVFTDTVIKLSINQGLEEQRIQETLGSFTMGELAFTRDTGRVFVGDNSDGEGEHAYLQSTVGGILVGNKYLGLIDSKPLVIFSDNGTPLSYEQNTHYTGSQELPPMNEMALLKENSKFRQKSDPEAAESWSNWPREARYNKVYNAYDGDYMFDPYQSAFIFFDSSISGNENSETQPVVKTDEFGEPVAPETFIIDGEEIPSTDPRAIDIKRRTKTVNYLINGEDRSTFPIYGDGYVISRILEPDNITIRLKKRAFENNGSPTSGNNISHNILEVGRISTSNMENVFNEDFIVADVISLNKNIKNVRSITSPYNGLKIPQRLIFSMLDDEGAVQGKMKWKILTPDYGEFTEGKQYEILLTSNANEPDPDTGVEYPTFSLTLNEKIEKVQSYYFNLGDGLVSSQENNKQICLDENSITTGGNLPTLSLEPNAETDLTKQVPDYLDPYNTGKEDNFEIVYSSNFGINSNGAITYIDLYEEKYYNAAKEQIDKWEGQNPSLNFIRKPVTIFSTSTDSSLYNKTEDEEIEENGESEILTQKTGVNAYVDFFVNPYLYCGRKIVSSPSTNYLPQLDDVSHYPTKQESTYFNNFTNTHIKTWNSLVNVLGNNHYKTLSNNISTTFFIDGRNGDHTKTDSVAGKVFKKIENIEYDENYSPSSREEETEEELLASAVFAWEKIEVTQQKSETISYWQIVDKFDIRKKSDIEYEGNEITFVKIKEQNILENTDKIKEIVKEETDEYGTTTKTTTRFLMPESTLLEGLVTQIVYGADGDKSESWAKTYDLYDNDVIQLYSEITAIKDTNGKWTDEYGYEIQSIDLVSGNQTTTISDAQGELNKTNGKLSIDYSYNGTKLSEQKIVVLVSKTAEETEEEGDNTFKTYYSPVDGVYYVVGAGLPGVVSSAKIKESNFEEVPIDETIQENEKITIPNHAQSIILEVEHKTSDNSPVGIFYANEFNQLGLLISGLPTKESENDSGGSLEDPDLTNSEYTSSNGTYKHTMGTSLASSEPTTFHSLEKSIEENKKLKPSCFYAAENEKTLFLSATSETRLIEVPLHKSNYNSLKHFSLRFANIKPTTPDIKNSLALRVIGYRV